MKVVFDCDTHVRNCTQFLPVLLELTCELIAPTASLVVHLVKENCDAYDSNKNRMFRISVLQVLNVHIVIFRVVTHSRLLGGLKGSGKMSPTVTRLMPFTS